MKIDLSRAYLLALAAAFTSTTLAQSFHPGNLVVLRLGNGSESLVKSGNRVFLDQYTTSGALIDSVAVPDNGTNALIISGTSTAEGGLTRSADRTMLAFAGYCTNRGSVSGPLANQTATNVPRGIATVDVSGNYSLVEACTNLYSGNNIRCAATDGTNNFWTAGTPEGTYYLHPPGAPVNVQTNAGANTIYVKIINGTLCFSTQKGTSGLYGFSTGGLPNAAAAPNLLFATGGSSQPQGFDLNPSHTLAYVADSRVSGGGIQKWTNDGRAWSLAYTLNTGAGALAVAVDFSGTVPIIYATTGESATNRLVCFIDTNSAATAMLLATAGANQWFKGLDFAPDLGPVILAQPQSQVVTNGSDASFSITASSSYALSYQWEMNGLNLNGQTTTTLTLTNLSATDQGTYQIIVANQYGSVTSAPAVLTVITELPGTIPVTGDGTVVPELNLGALSVGTSYTVTAVPGPGQQFAGWTGSITTLSPTLTFVMSPGFELTANFVPSPYVLTSGTYSGLFSPTNPNEVQPGTAGSFTISVTPRGTYSGFLSMSSRRYAFSGELNSQGRASKSFPGNPGPALSLVLRMGAGNQADQVFGSLASGTWVANLSGNKAVFNARTNSAPYAAGYTLVFHGQDGVPASPAGDGFGTVRVTTGGQVFFAGMLADGTPVSQSAFVSGEGLWPLYLSLYAGKGLLFGWLGFTNQADDDLTGPVTWIKPPVITARYYPKGFTNDLQVAGSAYVRPAASPFEILSLTNGTISFAGGELSAAFTNSITLGPRSHVTNSSPNRLSLSFSLSTGVFQGIVLDPSTRTLLPFGGAVLQKLDTGYGLLRGAHQTSEVVIEP
ncbi:exported hypothetical protein [Verrucomicrobia bacterium]|nr:exported hypothetical protein [Verrucomicrobiota bacterium]